METPPSQRGGRCLWISPGARMDNSLCNSTRRWAWSKWSYAENEHWQVVYSGSGGFSICTRRADLCDATLSLNNWQSVPPDRIVQVSIFKSFAHGCFFCRRPVWGFQLELVTIRGLWCSLISGLRLQSGDGYWTSVEMWGWSSCLHVNFSENIWKLRSTLFLRTTFQHHLGKDLCHLDELKCSWR